MNGFNNHAPIELINIVPFNPLISKCQIKVCWVGYQPNRNKSIITKDVAREMANSLPGSPIVGYYNETSKDFEEHNRSIDISNGKWTFKDTTRPYGFVGENAKVWFQWFLVSHSFEYPKLHSKKKYYNNYIMIFLIFLNTTKGHHVKQII